VATSIFVTGSGGRREAGVDGRRYPFAIGSPANRRVLCAALVIVAGLLAACGDDPSTVAGPPRPAPAATIATVPGHSYESELVTTDGRYKVTVAVGPPSATGGAECPRPASAGRNFLPVTVIVANEAADRPAPFPPLRIEMTSGAGAKPGQVLLRDPSGACTFTPKVPALSPGASVVFNGTSPAIDQAAAPGSAGRIEVSVSESRFTLAAPVP